MNRARHAALLFTSMGAIIGAWLSCYVLLLDWGQAWQRFPIPIMYVVTRSHLVDVPWPWRFLVANLCGVRFLWGVCGMILGLALVWGSSLLVVSFTVPTCVNAHQHKPRCRRRNPSIKSPLYKLNYSMPVSISSVCDGASAWAT